MPPITITTEISRAPADVFDYVTDPMRFPEWQRDVVRARMIDDGTSQAVGSKFTTTRRIAGAEQSLTQEIVESDKPRRWTARGIDGTLRPTGTLSFEPVGDGSSTRIQFEIEYDARGLGKVILPLVIRQTENGAPRSFARLKEILEAKD